MIFLLFAALLAALILAIVLGARKIITGTITALVVGFLWLFLAGLAGLHVGTWALGVVIGAPFAAVFIYGMILWARGDVDMWGNPIKRDKPKAPPPDKGDDDMSHIL